MIDAWGFYGRTAELVALQTIFSRERFFFARVTGRRRIGKTTLVREALGASGRTRVFYVQIPDSAPAGVLSATHDAMDMFGIPAHTFPRPDSLLALAATIEALIRAGYIVALDEFQYFSRKLLHEFLSHLQARVDVLLGESEQISGGLIVLGSLHAELLALLEDRDAPLYNRTTDAVELRHLDIASVLNMLDVHADREPERLLFLWNLFEGVPKFYRDCFEQGVLSPQQLTTTSYREALLAKMFFGSSSPLRTEAEHWFLSELRGRYDVILKHIARYPGCTHGELTAHVREISPETSEQVGGYLKTLIERYQLVERRLPIFAKPSARNGRYHIHDNFLRTWLAALHNAVSALNFRPLNALISQADARCKEAEGSGFERLIAQLYEERSRKGLGDFSLTRHISGYWDKKDTEIDLVALDEDAKIIRFGTCKRQGAELSAINAPFQANIDRFLDSHQKYRHWTIQRLVCAPTIEPSLRASLERKGLIVQDLHDLTDDL